MWETPFSENLQKEIVSAYERLCRPILTNPIEPLGYKISFMLGGDLARLALDAIADENALVTGRENGLLGRAHRVGRPRGEHHVSAGKNRIARLRRFIAPIHKPARDRIGNLELILCDDRARVA